MIVCVFVYALFIYLFFMGVTEGFTVLDQTFFGTLFSLMGLTDLTCNHYKCQLYVLIILSPQAAKA